MAGTKRKLEAEQQKDQPPQKKQKIVHTIPKFPDPHSHQSAPRYTGWEDDFHAMSTALRLKPNWIQKLKDKDIKKKWKAETSKVASCFWRRLKQELEYLASLSTDKAEPSSVDGVWQKDNLIPQQLRDEFVELVKNDLESSDQKLWHPDSNETVLDLVHPSLYCYVAGKTPLLEKPNHSQLQSLNNWAEFLAADGKVAEKIKLSKSINLIKNGMRENADTPNEDEDDNDGKSETKENEEEEEEEEEIEEEEEGEGEEDCFYYYSEEHDSFSTRPLKFDPALFNHQRAHQDPYGNGNEEKHELEANLDQRNLSNYLANLFTWIPSDISVSDEGKIEFLSYINGIHPIKSKKLYEKIANIMEYFIPLWNNVLSDIVSPSYSYDRYDEQDHEGISIETLKERTVDGGESLNELKVPERTPVELCGSKLQVIVKIASIELTPEKPTYDGSWHIEGVRNEAIISTGIYYYDQENIEDNFLRFREAIYDPENADSGQFAMGYGFGDRMNFSLGKVQTQQDRCIAFPNIYQHCVSTISLADKTKSGHRKMLVFFLVDPNINVPSSAIIPPPRRDWVSDAINSEIPEAISKILSEKLNTLPDLDTAKEYQKYLMFTRKFYVKDQNSYVFEREYSYCEH